MESSATPWLWMGLVLEFAEYIICTVGTHGSEHQTLFLVAFTVNWITGQLRSVDVTTRSVEIEWPDRKRAV